MSETLSQDPESLGSGFGSAYPGNPSPSSTVQEVGSSTGLPPFATFSSELEAPVGSFNTTGDTRLFTDTRLLDISNWDYYGEGLTGRLLERTENGLSIITSQPQYRPWESTPKDSSQAFAVTTPVTTFADAFSQNGIRMESKLPSFQSQFQSYNPNDPNGQSEGSLTTLTNLTPVSPNAGASPQNLNFHTLSTVNPRNYPLVPAPVQAREIPSIQQQFLDERHIQMYTPTNITTLNNALPTNIFPGHNGTTTIIQGTQLIQSPTVVTVLKPEPNNLLKLESNITTLHNTDTGLKIQNLHPTQFQNPMSTILDNGFNGLDKKVNGFSMGSPTRNDFRKKERRKIRASSLESSAESDGASSNMDMSSEPGQVAAISSTAGFKSPNSQSLPGMGNGSMETNMDMEISGGISGGDKQVKKKRKRCGECIGCQRKDNCGDCAPCRNDKSHQICKQRRCEKLTEKKTYRGRKAVQAVNIGSTVQAPEPSPQASRPSPPAHIVPTTMIKTTDQPIVTGQPGQQQPMAPMPFYADPNRFPTPVWQADPTQGWAQGQFIQQIPHTPQTPLEGYQQYPNTIYQPTYQQPGFETNTFYASPVQVLTPATQRPPSQGGGVSTAQGSVTPRPNGAYSHTPSPSPNQNGISRQNSQNISNQYQDGYQNPSSVQSYNPTTPTNMETASNGAISRPSSVGSNINSGPSFTPTSIGNGTGSGNEQPGFPQVSPSPQVASQPSSGFPGTHFSGQTETQQTWEQKNYDYTQNFNQNQSQNNQFLTKNHQNEQLNNQNFIGQPSPQNNYVNQSPSRQNEMGNQTNFIGQSPSRQNEIGNQTNFIGQSPQRQNELTNQNFGRPPSRPSEAQQNQQTFLGRPPSRPNENNFIGQSPRNQDSNNFIGQSPRHQPNEQFNRPPSRQNEAFLGQSPRSQSEMNPQNYHQSPNRSTPLPHPSPQNQINQSPNRPLQPPDNPFSQPERVNLNSRIKTMILNKQGQEETKNEQNQSATGHFLSYSHHRALNFINDGGGFQNFNQPNGKPSAIENMIKFATDENYTKWNSTTTHNPDLNNQFYPERNTQNPQGGTRNMEPFQPQKMGDKDGIAMANNFYQSKDPMRPGDAGQFFPIGPKTLEDPLRPTDQPLFLPQVSKTPNDPLRPTDSNPFLPPKTLGDPLRSGEHGQFLPQAPKTLGDPLRSGENGQFLPQAPKTLGDSLRSGENAQFLPQAPKTLGDPLRPTEVGQFLPQVSKTSSDPLRPSDSNLFFPQDPSKTLQDPLKPEFPRTPGKPGASQFFPQNGPHASGMPHFTHTTGMIQNVPQSPMDGNQSNNLMSPRTPGEIGGFNSLKGPLTPQESNNHLGQSKGFSGPVELGQVSQKLGNFNPNPVGETSHQFSPQKNLAVSPGAAQFQTSSEMGQLGPQKNLQSTMGQFPSNSGEKVATFPTAPVPQRLQDVRLPKTRELNAQIYTRGPSNFPECGNQNVSDVQRPGPSNFYPEKNTTENHNLPYSNQNLQEPLGNNFYGKNGSEEPNTGSDQGDGSKVQGPEMTQFNSGKEIGSQEVKAGSAETGSSAERELENRVDQNNGFVGVPIKKEEVENGPEVENEAFFKGLRSIKTEPGLEDKDPAYIFEGHGGPAPVESNEGSWCCRKGGTNPPTLEHLKDGGCSGCQTADEVILEKGEKNENVKTESNPTQDYLDNIEKLKNNIKTEIPDCNCFPPDKNPPEPGSYYTHLGCASSLEELRKDIESRTGAIGKGLRIEKVCYTGKEGKTTQGCPMAKWIIRRSSYEEKILAIVKHRQGHSCSSAFIVVCMVAWDGIPSHEADQTYSLLTHKLNKYGLPTTRRCATNESRTCACQGLDPDNCGASFSFGCSWSMYYNGCKYARSKTVRKFRLSVKSEENEIEEKMHILSTMLSPLYNSIAPVAFKNQCQFEREASECRLGFKTGRPFSGVTVCLDFCSHSHRDLHNMNNGCTVVVSLTKHRNLGKPPDEQLHVLPLYVIDETDEFGSKEAQEEKFKNGSIDKLSKYPCEVRVRSVPLQPCRRHGKKRKEDEPDAIIKKEAVVSPRSNAQSPRSSHGSPRAHTPGSHGVQTPLNDMANMLDTYTDAQLQSSQVSSTVLDSPNMYSSWNYQENMMGGSNHQFYNQNQLYQNQNWLEVQKRQNLYNPWGGNGFSRENIKEYPDSTTAISNLEEKAVDDKTKVANYDPIQRSDGNFSGQVDQSKVNGESTFRVPVGRPPSRTHTNVGSPDIANTFLKPYPPEKVPKAPENPQILPQHTSLGWEGDIKPNLNEYNYFNQGMNYNNYGNVHLNYDPYNPYQTNFGYDYGMRYHQGYGYHQGFSNWPGVPNGNPIPQGAPMYQNNPNWCVYPPFSIPYVPEQPKSEPIGVVQDFIENEECFKDSQIGGVAIALGHGSVLFECAKHELHSTTALRKPNRLSPTRISLVFYQHRNLNKPKHGLEEWEEKMRLRKLGITTSPVNSNNSNQEKNNPNKDPNSQKEKDLNYAGFMEASNKNGKQIMLKSPTLTTVSWTTLFPMHPCVVTGPYQNSQPIG